MKKVFKIVGVVMAITALFFGYKYYQNSIKPTKIAFVRVPDYIYADYSKADDSYFIKTKNFDKKDNLDELTNFDVVYIFAMGFNPNEEQKENLRKVIEKDIPLYVYLSTSEEMDMTTLTKKELKEVEKFFKNPNTINNKNLLNYTRKILDTKSFFTEEVVLAEEYPKNYFFHPSTENYFGTISEVETYYKKNNLHTKNAPKVLVLTSNLQPSNPSARAPYFALITELEKRNINVYATAGFSGRVDFINAVQPDLVVLIPHGRLAPGKSEEVLSILKELNIPVLGPQVMYEPYNDWLKNQKGLGGGMFSQNIIAPELDGVTTPYVIGAKFPREEDGVMIFKEIPERIESFSTLVENLLALKTKTNQDKKVTIFYYKGPGNNALSSEGMEIVPSILNLLKHLQKQGYNTGVLPKTSKELYAKIQKEGKLLGVYAKGTFEEFIKEGNPALIPADTLKNWMHKYLHPTLIKEAEKQYGTLPGEYMTTVKDSIKQLAVARVQFGNIVLMPQPLPAIGENEFKLVHGVKQATPYPYIGAYLWAREHFKSDAIIHFGTHGSLEFTPYKQLGLSDLDWSHALIGNTPHFYIYTIGNVGEGMIAKRRSYATLVSHLTPAFDESGFNSDMKKLHDIYHSFLSVQNNEGLKEEYKIKLRDVVLETKLDKQLNLLITKDKKLTTSELEKIAEYVHEVEAEKITLGLYTLGETFSQSKLNTTVKMMSYDPIAYSKATLDVLKGTITEDQKNDAVFFDKHYRVTTLKLVDKILTTDAPIIIEKYISKKDLAFLSHWQKENDTGNFEDAMAGMISMFEKIGEEKELPQVTSNKERVTELMILLLPNPKNRAAIEHLKDPLQFEKSSAILDRTSLKKIKAIAKLIPKMQEMLDVMLAPGMFQLLELMQNEDNYKLVFNIMEDDTILNSIKEKEEELEHQIITELLLAQNRELLFLSIKNAEFAQFISNQTKISLQKTDSLLNFYIAQSILADKINPQTTDEKVVVKVLESQKSLENIKQSQRLVKEKLMNIKEKEKQYAMAVNDIKTAILNVRINYNNLKQSPQKELMAITNALNGGFIAPSSGGDAVRNPQAVPSGRNLYSINAENTPTQEAWKLGVKMATSLLEAHLQKHNKYPKKIAFTLWGGEFIRGEGSTIAQLFYMLGVEPVWSISGNVKDVKLIPLEKLKRPRIDVVVQTSGQFRDFASSRIFLIDKAVALAANDKEENDTYQNFVKEGVLQMEKDLKTKGFTPEEARKFSTARVFGAVNGNYGTAVMGLVEKGDAWEKEAEIADLYIKNMGAIYTQGNWGEYKPGLFEASLKNTDMVVHPRSSNTWGPLSLDHVYEFMGGVTNAVRTTTGKDPDGYFADSRSKHNSFVQSVDEAIWVESQSTLFNPKYIQELMNGEASSAEVFAETTRDLYGWNVMKPSAIDPELWDKMHKVYVQDEYALGIKSFFEKENPYALQELTAVMLETVRKGYWKPNTEVIKEIAELHAELVKNHDAGCSGFVCDNAKLEQFISDNVSQEAKQQYQEKISTVREISAEQQQNKNIELKKVEKEQTLKELIADNKTISYLVLGLFLLLLISFIYGRVRRR